MSKRILLVYALTLPLFGCTAIREAVIQPVCDGGEQTTKVISEIGGFLGGPGSVAAGVINFAIKTGCKIFETAATLPEEAAKTVGIIGEETPAPASAGDGG